MSIIVACIFFSVLSFAFYQYSVANTVSFFNDTLCFKYFLTNEYKFLFFPVVVKEQIKKDDIDNIIIAPLKYFEKEGDRINSEKLFKIVKSFREMTLFYTDGQTIPIPVKLGSYLSGDQCVIYIKSKDDRNRDIVIDTRDSYSKKGILSFVNFLNSNQIRNSFIE